jgi:hypothetical protein
MAELLDDRRGVAISVGAERREVRRGVGEQAGRDRDRQAPGDAGPPQRPSGWSTSPLIQLSCNKVI